MLPDGRYRITLTDHTHQERPRSRIIYRGSDAEALDAAERELRRHLNVHGQHAMFDGWRLSVATRERPFWRVIAEVRPGYDSRTVPTARNGDPGVPPF